MPLSSPTGDPVGMASRLSAPTPLVADWLTGEQLDIVDAAHDGDTLVVEALAGTGKTSTLTEIARTMPSRSGLYLAFNKRVAIEADGKMPGNVTVSTAHAFAYQAIGKRYGNRLPGNPGFSRMKAQTMAKVLRAKPAMLDTGTVNPVALVRMAQATINDYIKTADVEIQAHHVPARILAHHSPVIVEAILPIAEQIWADLKQTDGRFYFTHDVYLKLWQLTNPVLPYSFVMFDESQDADPVIASVVARQAAQRMYVGDRNQAIYGWRGAIDAMSKIKDARRYPLTKSFRFGPAIAEAANHWLHELGSTMRVEGHAPIPSVVAPMGDKPPRAVLCRGNGTALGWILSMHQLNIPVALAPGDKNAGKDISRFAWAARDLMAGQGTDHPELVGFQTWKELVEYVEEEENTDDLKRMVGIINRVGINGVIDAIKGLVTEDRARVTISTGHQAKGLEWDSVRVADDFVPRLDGDENPIIDPESLMLNYVTVTRAKLHLDPGPLAEDMGLWTR